MSSVTYRAVVKHPLNATPEQRIDALAKGIEEIAMELVGDELRKDPSFVEEVFDNALSAAEHEFEMRRHREEEVADA